MEKVFKVYYKFLKGDIMDEMAGEKSPEQIARALENFPTDLRLHLSENDSIHILEERPNENYIIVSIETELNEAELKSRMEKPLTLGLLLCDEYKK